MTPHDRKAVITLFALGLLASALVLGYARTIAAQPGPGRLLPVDCSQFHSAGCTSFNQMLKDRDSGILARFSRGNIAYVCFESDADSFSVVDFDVPKMLPNHKGSGVLEFTQFRDGIPSNEFPLWGAHRITWTKYKFGPEGIRGIGDEVIVVNDEEITAQKTFRNVSGSTTTYSFTLWRSTGRYKETFLWGKHESSDTGHCVEK